MGDTQIYIATVLLERNRWKPGKVPTFQVSEWLGRFAEAGFDGIELWENHALEAEATEVERLKAAPLPITIFNSYATFDADGAEARAKAAAMAGELKAERIKFNIGKEESEFDAYVQTVVDWTKELPEGVRALCECHPGTVIETPPAAGKAFAVWKDYGVEAIIHPFNLTPDELRSWFKHLGDAITHAHVQLNRDRKMRSLSYDLDCVKENLKIMREEGFKGTFAIEFTDGVGAPDEDMDVLFAHAVKDMEILREYL